MYYNYKTSQHRVLLIQGDAELTESCLTIFRTNSEKIPVYRQFLSISGSTTTQKLIFKICFKAKRNIML